MKDAWYLILLAVLLAACFIGPLVVLSSHH